MFRVEAVMLRCMMGTRLGRPVLPLVATEAGWVCPGCPYTQDWAPTWMADGTWRNGDQILKREG